MMPDWPVVVAIGLLGVASYAMRIGGFLAASAIGQDSIVARFLRLAPGNLFVAFVAAACLEGGWPSLIGCACAFATMALTGKEWAALGAGFTAAALSAALVAR
jgi:uncharacterized membrane protein